MQKQNILPDPLRATTFLDASQSSRPGKLATTKSELTNVPQGIPQVVANFQRMLFPEDKPAKQTFLQSSLAPSGDRSRFETGIALKSIASYIDDPEEQDLLAFCDSMCDFNASYSFMDPVQSAGSRMSATPAEHEVYERCNTAPGSARAPSQVGAGGAYFASTMTSRMSSYLNAGEGRSFMEEDSVRHSVRLQYLRDSFSLPVEEIEQKVAELLQMPRWDDPFEDEDLDDGETSRSASQASATFFTRTASAQEEVERPGSPHDSVDSEINMHYVSAQEVFGESSEDFDEIRSIYQGSYLSIVPIKFPAPVPLDTRDDSASFSQVNQSEKEEILRATRLLNLYRWLCRLEPVKLDQDRTDCCSYLGMALLPRHHVFLKESNPQTRSLTELGKKLGGFMATDGRSMVLHKESSLISALTVGITSSHTEGWSCVSTSAPGTATEESLEEGMKEEVLFRARRYRQYLKSRASHYAGGTMDNSALQSVNLKDWRRVKLDNMPESLSGFKIFWELEEKNKEDASRARKHAGHKQHERKPDSARIDARHSMRSPSPAFSQATHSSWQASQSSKPRTPRQGDARRPGAGNGKVRTVIWNESESARRKELSRACNLSWGDRTNTVALRRQLLSPKLLAFGAWRTQDTCILWTGTTPDDEEDDELSREVSRSGSQIGSRRHSLASSEFHISDEDRAKLEAEARERREFERLERQKMLEKLEPDFVTFPPSGICPTELLEGCLVPVWTIMPNCRTFQPTQNLQVRMWRVRLIRTIPHETPSEKKSSLPSLPCPSSAERLEELPVTSVTCDCSAKGNSFCVIFRPQLARIREGDQFEVEVTGLRGKAEQHTFFHEFHSFSETDERDSNLFKHVHDFKELLDDIDIYAAPTVMERGSVAASSQPRAPETQPASSARARRGSFSGRRHSRLGSLEAHQHHRTSITEMPVASTQNLPDLGLVSHPKKDVHTDNAVITICLYCKEALALHANLRQIRAAGTLPVKRATNVIKLGHHFLVRVKLPCSGALYQLNFQMAAADSPEVLQRHPFMYTIHSSEQCGCPLGSLEHPLFEKFGYCIQPAVMQNYGTTICTPVDYTLKAERTYFLVHVQSGLNRPEAHVQPTGEVRMSSLFKQMRADGASEQARAIERGLLDGPDPLFHHASVHEGEDGSDGRDKIRGRRQARSPDALANAVDPMVAPVMRMHRNLESMLLERVQDCPAKLRLEVAVGDGNPAVQRYVTPLHPKPGYTEFFDCHLDLNEFDAGLRVSMFLRIVPDEDKASEHLPLKIAEWLVRSQSEALPANL
eukprot:TRINITY_DN17053_c0_g1_i1.p1 TRINITY_DN17053_c0_g1~~TRINITY_DN17053_c0_g1_i1.p1  ORF type:complete len:1365 (-),score=200.39 TRINITY_DN17053_c0_g1_i1:126-3992(-)